MACLQKLQAGQINTPPNISIPCDHTIIQKIKMKKLILPFFYLLVAGSYSCNKPESVLFADQSGAMIPSKADWTATASSEITNGGKASSVIDGNITTYWHTDTTVTPVRNYPHWILIDMKSDRNIVTVSLTNRQSGTALTIGMKSFKLEGSKDGSTFTSLGEFNLAVSNNAQTFRVSSANAYRYLKITALTSQTGTTAFTFLAEVDLFVVK